MNITANIQAARHASRLPQAEIARRLNIEPASYHRLEKRDKKLSLEQVEKIAFAMGLTLMELLTWDANKPKAKTSTIGQFLAGVRALLPDAWIKHGTTYSVIVEQEIDRTPEYGISVRHPLKKPITIRSESVAAALVMLEEQISENTFQLSI